MSNYPKMLYKGDKIKYEYQTASNEESEKELLDSGWVVFGELPELTKNHPTLSLIHI